MFATGATVGLAEWIIDHTDFFLKNNTVYSIHKRKSQENIWYWNSCIIQDKAKRFSVFPRLIKISKGGKEGRGGASATF